MRESEGVYQFGTKRVAVKVEKNRIKIRVGGGYLSIDEFLDQYTPAQVGRRASQAAGRAGASRAPGSAEEVQREDSRPELFVGRQLLRWSRLTRCFCRRNRDVH